MHKPKRRKLNNESENTYSSSEQKRFPEERVENDISFAPVHLPTSQPQQAVKRPWKDVYAERLVVERNWRKPKFQKRILSGKFIFDIRTLRWSNVNPLRS